MALYTGTLVADGSTAGIVPSRRERSTERVAISVVGTWGNGTITIEAAVDGTNYAPIARADGTDLEFSADFADGVLPPPGVPIRLTLTGATGPDLDWAIASDGG